MFSLLRREEWVRDINKDELQGSIHVKKSHLPCICAKFNPVSGVLLAGLDGFIAVYSHCGSVKIHEENEILISPRRCSQVFG